MNLLSMTSAISAVELGLLYALVTLGLFVSYRILDIPDLTVDGSFTLGAAVSAVWVVAGHPVLGIFMATLAGALAGLVTAGLQTKLKVHPILAGILTMTGLYSINIMVMQDKANVPLLGLETVFTYAKNTFGNFNIMIIGLLVIGSIGSLLAIFLFTRLGLAIRATGDNEAMVRASSINVDLMKIIGLALANALVAMGGAFLAQKQSYADAGMGTGMIVIGIASLIIGEVIVDIFFRRRTIITNIIAAIIGSIIYRIIIAQALVWDITTSSMKLVSAIIVGIAISYPVIQKGIKHIINQRQRMSIREKTSCSR